MKNINQNNHFINLKTFNMKTNLKWYVAQWQELESILIENSDFCRELDIHPGTARRYRREGLPYIQIAKKFYYRLSDILPIASRLAESRKDGKKTQNSKCKFLNPQAKTQNS